VEAVLKVAEEEMAAAKAGDVQRSLAILSDDYERIAPNQPAIRGEQVRQEMMDSQEQSSVEFTYSNQEVGVDGDLAYHRYSYNMTLIPENGGEPIRDQGAGIQILRRDQDGSWKITKDIWNSDSPPPDQQ
jgi:ketosteroid isomerase-like protein